MTDRTTVGYSVNVARADVEQAIKTVALKRLREESPGLELDAADWYERAEVFLPAGLAAVQVTLAKP